MNYIQKKLFFALIFVASVLTHKELEDYISGYRREADFLGFMDGYRAGKGII